MKILFALFVMAHGLLHASYLTPKPEDPNYPFSFDKGWFASVAGNMAQPIGTLLVAVTVVAFLLAGLGLLGVPGLVGIWKMMLLAGAIASLLLLVLFWHQWLVLGIVINIVLVYGVYKLNWMA